MLGWKFGNEPRWQRRLPKTAHAPVRREVDFRLPARPRLRVIIERCCGLDVHQETVVACLLIGAPGDRPTKEVRTFRTVTRDLEALRDWLAAAGVTHVGMESTGVYWRPVYAVLEGHFDLIVGNARHIRNVPGRKTDVKDAEWIADLVRHGLIAKSFVPPRPLREMRELFATAATTESQAAERNRLLKLLETANIKLASVMSDVFGVSGRAMLRALIECLASVEAMADLARGQLRTTAAPVRPRGLTRSAIALMTPPLPALPRVLSTAEDVRKERVASHPPRSCMPCPGCHGTGYHTYWPAARETGRSGPSRPCTQAVFGTRSARTRSSHFAEVVSWRERREAEVGRWPST